MRGFYLLVLLVLISFLPLQSQTGASEFFSVLSGLPHSDVKEIFIDPEGFLWIGTSNGVSRYDGYSFHNFTANTSEIYQLQSDYIFAIDNASYDKLVFLTRKGFEIYTKRDEKFYKTSDTSAGAYNTQVAYNDISGTVFFSNGETIGYFDATKPNIDVSLIAQAQINDELKIYSSDSCLWIFYNNNLVKYNTITSAGSAINELDNFTPPNKIQDIVSVDRNILAVLSYPDIFLLKKNNLQILKTIRLHKSVLDNLDKAFCKIHTNKTEGLIVYDHSNAYLIDILTKRTSCFFTSQNKGEYINTLVQDNSGVIWIGTTKGLRKLILIKQPIRLLETSESTFNGMFYKLESSLGTKFLLTKGDQVIEFNSNKFVNSARQQPVLSFCEFGNDNLHLFISDKNKLNLCRNGHVQVLEHNQLKNRIINNIQYSQSDSLIYISSNKGICVAKYDYQDKAVIKIDKIIADTIAFDKIVLTENSVIAHSKRNIIEIFTHADSLSGHQIPKSIKRINDILIDSSQTLWLATSNGLYSKERKHGQIRKEEIFFNDIEINSLVTDNDKNIWLASNKGLMRYSPSTKNYYWFNNSDGVPNTIFKNASAYKLSNGELIFVTYSGCLNLVPQKVELNENQCKVQFVEGILFEPGISRKVAIHSNDTLKVKSQVKNSEVVFSALDYYAPQFNTYEYSLNSRNKNNEWNFLGHKNSIIVSNLSSGIYTLRVRGRNNQGKLSRNEAVVYIDIQAPLWQSKIAYVAYVGLLVLIVYLIVNARTRQLQRSNREFREKERIATKVRLQKEELTLKNKSITDSINYARRIQMAMMPSYKTFRSFFPESFILYLPKDIVSGDFYWVNDVEDRIFFSAVDCTGHGVPGAFMSIIGFELFRRITESDKGLSSSEILDELSENLLSFFTDEEGETLHDGMDLAFCTIDKKMRKLQYAGAFNPLYLVRDNSIIEYKGNRFSVGWNGEDVETQTFTNHEIDLLPGDVIYIFTDGYADQFGGADGKKYKYRRFRHLLLALHQLSLERQEEFLKKSIMEWKGENEQVDDILVMGIRIPSV